MHVYFCKTSAGAESFVKIGKANKIKKRLSELQIGCPWKLEIIETIECVDEAHAVEVEKRAHKIFAEHSALGEWFRLTPEFQDLAATVIEFSKRKKAVHDASGEKMVTLEAWAKANFGPPPKSITLRRWAAAGRISPAPQKIGRVFYVLPTAGYVTNR